jgi:hypothetical protein
MADMVSSMTDKSPTQTDGIRYSGRKRTSIHFSLTAALEVPEGSASDIASARSEDAPNGRANPVVLSERGLQSDCGAQAGRM